MKYISPNGFLHKIVAALLCFSLFAGYVIVAPIVGEEHPFSRFNMYAMFPNTARYYYLADENNKPISGARKFRFSINQIKDAIAAREKRNHIINGTVAQTKPIADEVLAYIINRNKDNPELKNYRQLKIMKCNITLNNGVVTTVDSVVSIWNLKAAY